MSTTNWDKRFLSLAEHVSAWSKDPSTKAGAVITKGKFVVSLGYNGFPAGVEDSEERLNNREVKYKLTLHAEENAILTAKEDIGDGTVYTYPIQPCSKCTAKLIQKGVKRIVAPAPTGDILERWGEDFELSRQMCQEAGIELVIN